jgi:membrane protein
LTAQTQSASPAGGAWDHARGRPQASREEAPPRHWRELLSRVKARVSRDNLSIVAAGVGFYALLAVFPGLAALISIYGLAFDPQEVEGQLSGFGAMLPPQAMEVLLGQLREVARTAPGALGMAAIGGLLLTLWSAAAGIKTLMVALNVAYHQPERRGFLKFNAVALALTLASILAAVLAIATVVAIPALIKVLDLGSVLEGVLSLARWPVLALVVVLGLGVLYRYGPSREAVRGGWFNWGAVIATLLWLAGSALFSFYVSNFGKYNETYGSVGAIVVLLLWFLLTAYVILVGAEIDAVLERRTSAARDAPNR